jgi:hypothetical protein
LASREYCPRCELAVCSDHRRTVPVSHDSIPWLVARLQRGAFAMACHTGTALSPQSLDSPGGKLFNGYVKPT